MCALAHPNQTTSDRHPEISTKAKIDAIRATEPPGSSAASRVTPPGRTGQALLDWLPPPWAPNSTSDADLVGRPAQ
jgi:hypothetical protein